MESDSHNSTPKESASNSVESIQAEIDSLLRHFCGRSYREEQWLSVLDKAMRLPRNDWRSIHVCRRLVHNLFTEQVGSKPKTQEALALFMLHALVGHSTPSSLVLCVRILFEVLFELDMGSAIVHELRQSAIEMIRQYGEHLGMSSEEVCHEIDQLRLPDS